MFKKLLFATTASPVCDNAAKVAFDLELKWEAKLFILHVLGVPARSFSLQFTDVRTGERELGRTVVEGRRRPRGGCVALCAIMVEVVRHVVRIGYSGECRLMTGITGG